MASRPGFLSSLAIGGGVVALKKMIYVVVKDDGYVVQSVCAFSSNEEAERFARACDELETTLTPFFGYTYRVEPMALYDASDEIRPITVYVVRVDPHGQERSRWEFMDWKEEESSYMRAAAIDADDGGAIGYSTVSHEKALGNALAFLRARHP
jgi:hypothetical protein